MKSVTRYAKRIKLTYLKCSMVILFLVALFFPSYTKFESEGDNTFRITLNGTYVGTLTSVEEAENCLIQARRNLSKSRNNEIVLSEANLTWEGSEVLRGVTDDPSLVTANMEQILGSNQKEVLSRAYTVKIGQYTVNLRSTDEVQKLLQAALDRFDPEGNYTAELNLDENRELTVLTAHVKTEEALSGEGEEVFPPRAVGIFATLEEAYANAGANREKDFEEYEQGIIDMCFPDTIEIVECHLKDSEITPLDTAISDVTKDQEKEQIYEVVAGDTLSQIAEKHELTVDGLVAINPTLEDETSLIRIGDELIITVPQPELSVDRQEQLYYEEDYEADIIYVDNDEWYTTQTKTLQEPSAGHRKVVAVISYHNSEEVSRDILKEEVTYEAVAKIVERGTKIPPTYVKPISGGRLTSPFGRRNRPTKGASSYHKGVDWSTPVGTAVMASCGGTVTRAGWGRGYGYCVYIRHADGRETRYGHLSKVLVSVGQTVSQGQKIALSGNTGVSTGPHLHFEILIGGSQVNPLKYLN